MLRTILLFFLTLPILGMAAPGRTGELDVRLGNTGVPCFTVSAREEQRSGTPQFQSITVSEAGAYSAMWSMAMPKGRSFALAYYMCVPYGGRPPVLPQTPVSELQRGKPYEVVVNAQPGKQGAPRHYRARFCVHPGADTGVSLLAPGRACPR
jgi:hypothetical protein